MQSFFIKYFNWFSSSWVTVCNPSSHLDIAWLHIFIARYSGTQLFQSQEGQKEANHSHSQCVFNPGPWKLPSHFVCDAERLPHTWSWTGNDWKYLSLQSLRPVDSQTNHRKVHPGGFFGGISCSFPEGFNATFPPSSLMCILRLGDHASVRVVSPNGFRFDLLW